MVSQRTEIPSCSRPQGKALPPSRQEPCVVLKRSYDDKRVSQHRAAGGRLPRNRSMVCGETTDCPLPPLGSRGRGPWSGRGCQRVKPRLVSPFEKKKVVSQRTEIPSCGLRQGKALIRISIRSRGSPLRGSVGMTVRVGRRDGKVRAGAGWTVEIPEWQELYLVPKTPHECQQSLNTEQLAVGTAQPVDGMRKHPRPSEQKTAAGQSPAAVAVSGVSPRPWPTAARHFINKRWGYETEDKLTRRKRSRCPCPSPWPRGRAWRT